MYHGEVERCNRYKKETIDLLRNRLQVKIEEQECHNLRYVLIIAMIWYNDTIEYIHKKTSDDINDYTYDIMIAFHDDLLYAIS